MKARSSAASHIYAEPFVKSAPSKGRIFLIVKGMEMAKGKALEQSGCAGSLK
jgi:hypothetical protein